MITKTRFRRLVANEHVIKSIRCPAVRKQDCNKIMVSVV